MSIIMIKMKVVLKEQEEFDKNEQIRRSMKD